MEKRNSKIPVWLTVSVMASLVVMVAVSLQVKKQMDIVNNLQKEVDKERLAQEGYESLLEQYDRNKAVGEDLGQLLVLNEEKVAEFAAGLEALAEVNQLSLEIGFDDLPVKIDLGGKSGWGLKFELKLQGGYEEIERFLIAVERGGYLVKEEKILLSRTGQDLDYGMVVNGILIMRQKT